MPANQPERIAFILQRNTVFSRIRDKFAASALVAWCAVAVLACVNGVMAMKLAERPREYFGLDASGSLLPMIPLSSPSINLTGITNFVVEGVTLAHTYNPLNWRRERMEVSKYFMGNGWTQFQQQLDRTSPDGQKIGIQGLIEKGVVTTAVPRSAPVILESRVNSGVLHVVVQFPMIVTYQGNGAPASEQLLVTATVARRPLLEHPLGIGIIAMTTRPYTGN